MGGKVYGPYASDDPKQYKVNTSVNPPDQYFIDPWGNEILYYRSVIQPGSTPKIVKVFETTAQIKSLQAGNPPQTACFSWDDCKMGWNNQTNDPTAKGTKPFFQSLGSSAGTNAVTTGAVLGSDSYLLISAGPDGIYFNNDDIVLSAK